MYTQQDAHVITCDLDAITLQKLPKSIWKMTSSSRKASPCIAETNPERNQTMKFINEVMVSQLK